MSSETSPQGGAGIAYAAYYIDEDLLEAVDDFISSLSAYIASYKGASEGEKMLSIADASLEHILLAVSGKLQVDEALKSMEDRPVSLEEVLRSLGPEGLRSLMIAAIQGLEEPHGDKVASSSIILRIVSGFNRMLADHYQAR